MERVIKEDLCLLLVVNNSRQSLPESGVIAEMNS